MRKTPATKRKAPGADPAFPSPSASAPDSSSLKEGRRTRAKPAAPGSLNDDSLADAAANGSSAEVDGSTALREFWDDDRFTTPELLAWIIDFDLEGKKKKLRLPLDASRSIILDALVAQTRRFPPPIASKAKAQLVTNLAKVGLKYPSLLAPLSPPPSPHQSAARSRTAASPIDIDPPAAKPRDSGATARALAKAQEDHQRAMEDDAEAPESVAPARLGATVHFAAPAAFSPPIFASLTECCLTCALSRPVGSTGPWRCAGCGLRGDLPTDNATNIFLAQQAAQRLAAAASASSASSGNSASAAAAGQKHTDADTASSRLDKEFERQARAEPESFPIFDERSVSESEAASLVSSAFGVARLALSSTQFKPPSKSLINLIQKGKLRHIGHAMPRPVVPLNALSGEDVEGVFTFSAGGKMTAISKEGLEPPQVPSLAAWVTTLHAVILPALAAQPKAQLEWLALSLTMEALERKEGWPFARDYCDLLLESRVPRALPFARVDEEVMRDLRLRDPSRALNPRSAQSEAGRAKPQPRQQSLPRPPSSGAPSHFCCNWNHGVPCGRDPCTYPHVCMSCGGQHPNCKRAPRGSGSSVMTEQAAAKAPASASIKA